MNSIKVDVELDVEQLKKKLELKSMDQVQDLYKIKGIDGTSSVQVLNKFANGCITTNNLLDIMQKGVDEFKTATGRDMTYEEMREMYG
jgi:hypothetical protein